MENKTPQTAKLPPKCRTLVLIAFKLPHSLWFTPTGELQKPLTAWEVTYGPHLKSPTTIIYNSPRARLSGALLHPDSTCARDLFSDLYHDNSMGLLLVKLTKMWWSKTGHPGDFHSQTCLHWVSNNIICQLECKLANSGLVLARVSVSGLLLW